MDYPDIITYLNGHGTAEEKEAVEKWISADEKNEMLFQNIRQVWEASVQEKDPEQPDIDKAWKIVRERTLGQQPKKLRWGRRIAGIAAVLLIGLIAYFKLPLWIPAPMEVVATQMEGIPTKVSLPDGTSVWLNKHSKIVFPKKFGGTERVVELSGEAFFEVYRNEQKPFRIKTADTQIKVLGTSFDVMAYPDSTVVRVQVSSGRVSFSADKPGADRLVLNKDEEAYFDKQSTRLEKSVTPQANRIAWKTRVLAFDDTSIAEAIPLIEDIYQVRLEPANKDIGNCRFTATFDNEPLDNILETMNTLFDIKTEKKQPNRITLVGQGCPTVQ